jgi:hypothetical protein
LTASSSLSSVRNPIGLSTNDCHQRSIHRFKILVIKVLSVFGKNDQRMMQLSLDVSSSSEHTIQRSSWRKNFITLVMPVPIWTPSCYCENPRNVKLSRLLLGDIRL